MPRGTAEQAEVIIPKLREVEVGLRRGKIVAEAVKKIGVTEQTYHRWKKLTGEDVLERLADLFLRRGVPEHIQERQWRSSPPGASESG